MPREKPTAAPDPLAALRERFRDVHLAIVTPTLFEVTAGYCISMLALTRHLEALKITYGTCIQPGCTLLGEARSAFVASFLASKGTHLLMIDSDVEFAPEVATKLLAADRDVIGAAVPTKRLDTDRVIAQARAGHPDPVVFHQDFSASVAAVEAPAEGGIVEVEWLAPGFVLLKRAALERMVAAYPELSCTTSLYAQGPICFLFQQLVEDGKIAGEDISFFKRWRRIGGKCHVLVDAEIGHMGRFTFVGNFGKTLAASPVRAMATASTVRLATPTPTPSIARRDGSPVAKDDACPCGSGRTLENCHGK